MINVRKYGFSNTQVVIIWFFIGLISSFILSGCGAADTEAGMVQRPVIPAGAVPGGAVWSNNVRRQAMQATAYAAAPSADFAPAFNIDPLACVFGSTGVLGTYTALTRLKVLRGYRTQRVDIFATQGIGGGVPVSTPMGAALYRYDSGVDPLHPTMTLLASGFILASAGSPNSVMLDHPVDLEVSTAYVLGVYIDASLATDSISIVYKDAATNFVNMTAIAIDGTTSPTAGFPSPIVIGDPVFQPKIIFASAIPDSGFGILY